MHNAARERLAAARLVGAAALAGLGQFAIDMPHGYFGPTDRMTQAGIAFTAAEVVLATVAVAGLLGRRRWAPFAAVASLALVIGAFVGALAESPVVAGGIALWCLVLAGNFLFPAPLVAAQEARSAAATDALDRWLSKNGPAARHLTAVSLVATTAVVGYGIGASSVPRAICLGLAAAVTAYTARFLARVLRSGSRAPLLAVTLLLAALASAGRPAAALGWLAAYQAVVLLLVVVRSEAAAEVIEHFVGRPALLVLVSFVVLIALGTLVLSFPVASATGEPVSPIDALFTSTSAACVTGLIVLDTPRDFSWPGQLVILLLIQAGGLNIMVLSAFAALLLRQGLGLRGEQALGEVLDLQPTRSPRRLVAFIVVSTLAVEAVGAAILTVAFVRHGEPITVALWRGLFTAVSAFCNAGFALQTNSLIGYAANPAVLLTVAALITLGGLGFAVLAFGWLRASGNRGLGLATQARLVVTVSIVLVVGGALAYGAIEWHRTLSGLGPFDKACNALFQSVTMRTAGFNSVSFDRLHPATLLITLLLMFIGASPGGTGGGIKTTTAAVLLSSVTAVARGESRAVVFGRTIPLETVYRSAAVTVLGVLVVSGAAVLLLMTQNAGLDMLMFETVSAFGTVGLSLGVTPHLDILGKLVIVVVMVIGRVGPLSLALLLGRRRPGRVEYPEARIMVG